MVSACRAGGVALVLALAACASAPPPSAAPTFDANAAVALVRAAGQAQSSELDVQPLRDPQVEDLRQQAAQQEKRQDFAAAAQALDHALSLQPADAQDPAVLQERAEIALLQRDLDGAETLARKAITLGSTTGPLCRRHWETVLQVAQVRAQDRRYRGGESDAQATARVGAADALVKQARAQRDACTIAAPARY